MSLTTRIVVAVLLLALLGWLLVLVRQRQLRGKYVLFWFVGIIALDVLALWPAAARALIGEGGKSGDGGALGGFLLAAAAFALLALVHAAWELSRLEARSRALAEEVALSRLERDSDDLLADAPPAPGNDISP
jgi:hypothetical protein